MSLALWLIGAALAQEPAPEPVDAPPPSDGSGGIVGGIVGPPLEQPSAQDAAPAEAVRVVHWSEVTQKVRVTPKFPEEAKGQGITEATCQIRFTIDEKGAPIAVEPVVCPEAFVASATEAAWKWRFYPAKVSGVPTKVSFLITLQFTTVTERR